MKHTTDQSLIEACLAGRREAFGQLVERYQHRLFHSLVHLLGSTEDAQDAAQDALILAFEKLGTFRGESQFYSWLFRIAYNSAVSSKRKTGPMSVSLEARRDASGLEPADLNPSTEPSFGLDVSDRQRLVQQALGELSEEFRAAIVLKANELRRNCRGGWHSAGDRPQPDPSCSNGVTSKTSGFGRGRSDLSRWLRGSDIEVAVYRVLFFVGELWVEMQEVCR